MRAVTLTLVLAAAAVTVAGADAASLSARTPAKVLFSKAELPSPDKPRPIGSYANGCMAGGEALAIDGPHWQVMRLSRNRNWGQPELVKYLEALTADVAAHGGWNGLLIGDMAQPRGGPTLTGHASHQTGLDVDIWLEPMPDHVMTREEREKKGAQSVLVKGKRLTLDPRKWSDAETLLLKRAASFPEVTRIFASPAIKKQLCETAGTDRAWLRKIRPWYGHDDHIHVRLACPPGVSGCDDQAAPPEGDGCGTDLASWFRPPPPPPKHPVKPKPPPPEKTLADLPSACTQVLTGGPGGVALTAGIPVPAPRPTAAAASASD
jgi:penicillin-insensitive murein endopeptidase